MGCRIPTWDLWGDSKIIECPYTGIFATTTVTGQLNKISYGRPETWNFFFYAKGFETILAVVPSIVSQELKLDWNLTIGIGRSSTTIPGFEKYVFSGVPGSLLTGQVIYSSMVIAPPRTAGGLDPNQITEFVAQDIQMNVNGVYSFGATHGDLAKVEIAGYFAPMSHIRPEWFERRFPGGEDHGQ